MDLKAYKRHLQESWGQLQYDIVFQQLAGLVGQKILDFGSGFGLISDFLAHKNQVLAIEPSAEMIAERKQTYVYEQRQGSIELLAGLADNSFDTIVCHNVLEYVSDQIVYLKEFARLLKQGGQLSLVKHNHVGRIMQTVVFENDVDKAQKLLNGQTYQTHSMGEANLYEVNNVIRNLPFKIQSYQGIRIFYGLQANEFKTNPEWRENMLSMELAVCNQSPYRDIAAFQHVWLIKKD